MSPSKKRADLLLTEQRLTTSRSQAETLIRLGRVFAKNQRIEKPGTLLDLNLPLEVREANPFVSRGGIKLCHALKELGVEVQGKVCLDVGASTGGFTDCLLQNGAQKVYAVDVGHGQLDPKLRQDERVAVLEKTHISRLSLPEKVDLGTVDVSFISLTNVLPAIASWLKEGGEIVALVKPQFELSPKEVKKGVVRERAARYRAVEKIKEFAASKGWVLFGETESPIPGPKGNREFFLHLKVGFEETGKAG